MNLILGLLLIAMTLGAVFKDDESNATIVEPEIIVDDVIPESFAGNIIDNYNVLVEIKKLITDYMDSYYKSLYTLEFNDTSIFFSNDLQAKLSNNAIKLMLETRALYDFDFTMNKAHYDLNITNYYLEDNLYYVDFLEDDYMSFTYLNGISSESYDIENSMIIEKVNDEYKIKSYDKTQGYYLMFLDNIDEDLDAIYDYYYKKIKSTIEDENYKKGIAQTNPYVANVDYEVPYDRLAASEYADKYCHTRNDKWYDFSDEGGNCQNFASQCLIAGNIHEDESGEYEWYFNRYSDYATAWVHVSTFNEYCDANSGVGPVTDLNNNIYYAQPGDIVQVGIDSVSHTTIVSKIVDGHILLNSNSIDMKDFPLEAYTYPTRKLIKILGSNS